jgi:Mn-dependent DtxR family transcriptional regulator
LNWETLDRLYKKGYISDPQIKSPTVTLSEEGERLSKELFFKHFGV